MTTKSRGVAFEKLSRNANEKEERINWGDVIGTFIGAIIVVGIIYFFSGILLGLN